MTNYGFGTPFAQVTPEQFQKFRMARNPVSSLPSKANHAQFQFITQLTYVWAFVTAKMSFAVLYFRLLPSDLSRRMNQVLLVVLALEGIVATLVVSMQCIPLQKAWNPALDGACLDLRTFYYVSVGILNLDPCLGADILSSSASSSSRIFACSSSQYRQSGAFHYPSRRGLAQF